MDGVEIGFRLARQIHVGCAVGFEWNNVCIVPEANEGATKKVGAGGVAAPEAFLIEQERVKLDNPGDGLGAEEILVHVVGQVFGLDLVNSQNLAQEVKEVRRFRNGPLKFRG